MALQLQQIYSNLNGFESNLPVVTSPTFYSAVQTQFCLKYKPLSGNNVFKGEQSYNSSKIKYVKVSSHEHIFSILYTTTHTGYTCLVRVWIVEENPHSSSWNRF